MEAEDKAWNPKGGRPKKEEKDLRNKPIKIKLTQGEKTALYKESEQLGWKQPYVYFRNKLLSKEGGPGHNPKVLFKAIDKLNPQLNKVGTNINQIARYINYLDKNKMIDQKIIAEYNQHFKSMIEVQQEYTAAMRAYLRSITKQ